MKRILVLEDGTVFRGEAIGFDQFKIGELVFNTGMSGYQEVISDPSYYGQLVTCAFPLTGNYGISHSAKESLQCEAFGIVVNEMEESEEGCFNTFLQQQKVPGIKGIDTRMLVRKLRSSGVMKATFVNKEEEIEEILRTLKKYVIEDVAVMNVSIKKAYLIPNQGIKIGVIDFGVKMNIIREFNQLGCEIYVLPHTTTATEIQQLSLDGLVLSNGPGDPKTNKNMIHELSKLIDIPTFGICLGHQLLALAHGGDTYKLKFGHRGINHPVQNLENNRVEITSQNHGYAVVEESITEVFTVTHRSLNDGSIEGLAHREYPIFSVQYHPESSPGPHDSRYLFTNFLTLIKEHKNGKA